MSDTNRMACVVCSAEIVGTTRMWTNGYDANFCSERCRDHYFESDGDLDA